MTLRRLRCGLLLAVFGACLLVGPALRAEDAPAADGTNAAEDRAQTFEAVSGAVKEDIAGGPLMLAAYAVVWLALFGYVFRLVRLQRGLEDNLARVEKAVASASKTGN